MSPSVPLEPTGLLLGRLRADKDLLALFPGEIQLSRAPGRLDVMGGIADYTGSLVCEATLDRAAVVALSPGEPGWVNLVSLNMDSWQCQVRISTSELLAQKSPADLGRLLADRQRRWAGYVLGCLWLLYSEGLIEAGHLDRGLNIALMSTVPLGGGVSSSAAIEVATMMNLRSYFPGLAARLTDPMRVAALCQSVENNVVGAPCGIMDQVASLVGTENGFMRLLCQPHELQRPLHLPADIRTVGINSRVKHSVGGGQYGITRCAAFMAHRMILDQMRVAAETQSMHLREDPMRGYLANLDPADYKKLFRPQLPPFMSGAEFIARHGTTIDSATRVDPAQTYPVQHAADHHVLEARRVHRFCEHLEDLAYIDKADPMRAELLNMAGHLMYASHLSYTCDAMLGAPECDVLVDLVREYEGGGLFGAKITGGGSGGTVAVLCERSSRAEATLTKVMGLYRDKTGKEPDLFPASSPGAWHVGTWISSL